MQRTHTPTTAAGFTLIEILVVMAIIGMLAVMVAPRIFNQQAGAQRDTALSQISALEAALDTYRLEVGQYRFAGGAGGKRLRPRGLEWSYLRRSPLDPWGNEYVYDSDGRGFTLVSYGQTVSAVVRAMTRILVSNHFPRSLAGRPTGYLLEILLVLSLIALASVLLSHVGSLEAQYSMQLRRVNALLHAGVR